MTETYKGLDKPAPASTSMASINIETAQLVEALRRGNIETVQNLAEHLKPVSTSLATLADAANRGIAERMASLDRTVAKIERLHEATDEVTRKAKGRIEAASKMHGEALAKMTTRQMALMVLVAILSAPLSVSIYSVWRNRYSDRDAIAANWEWFNSAVYPKLELRCQANIQQISKSSSAH